MPSTPETIRRASSARRASSSRSEPKMRTERSAGVPPEALVDPHPQRCREEHRNARDALHALAHRLLEIGERAAAIRLQDHEHVRDRVRHGILGALGTAGASDHVFDIGELAQDVLDAMVDAVDLVQGRLGGKDRLQEEGSLVEGRHEVAADEHRQHEHGHRQRQRTHHDPRRVAASPRRGAAHRRASRGG